MDDSPFQKLPGELRSYIGELALTQSSSILVKPQRVLRRSNRPRFVLVGNNKHMLAFTQTSKQLRSETPSLLWSCKSFVVELGQGLYPVERRSLTDGLEGFLAPLTFVTSKAPNRSIGSLTIVYGPISGAHIWHISQPTNYNNNLFKLMTTAVAVAKPKVLGRISFRMDFPRLYILSNITIDGEQLQESISRNRRMLLSQSRRQYDQHYRFATVLNWWERYLAPKALPAA